MFLFWLRRQNTVTHYLFSILASVILAALSVFIGMIAGYDDGGLPDYRVGTIAACVVYFVLFYLFIKLVYAKNQLKTIIITFISPISIYAIYIFRYWFLTFFD